MATTLVRIDKNGTKYFESDTCPKCRGTGYLGEYAHVESGRCFLCEGTGYHIHKWKEMTPEHKQELAEKRLAKARAKAPEINAHFLASKGFSEDGKTWIVLGNTYEVKDELKADGAKFDRQLGWHFDHEPAGWEAVALTIDEVADLDEVGKWVLKDDAVIASMVKELKAASAPESVSAWVGNEGERITVEVKCISTYSYTTHYTYSGETHVIYRLGDAAGNILVWKTQGYKDIADGQTYKVTGTVKAHDEYKGEKQTVLTRCKVVEA